MLDVCLDSGDGHSTEECSVELGYIRRMEEQLTTWKNFLRKQENEDRESTPESTSVRKDVGKIHTIITSPEKVKWGCILFGP